MNGRMSSGGVGGFRAPDLSFFELKAGTRPGQMRHRAIEAHRAAATGDARAARAAREFQALFLMEMLKPLTESLSRNALTPDAAGAGSGIYDWFWQEALATELARGWPLPEIPGVAEAVESSGGQVREAGAISAADRFRGAPSPVIPFGVASRMNLPPSIRQTLDSADGGASRLGAAESADETADAGAAASVPSTDRAANEIDSARAPGHSRDIDALAVRAGKLFGVSPNLVRAVVAVESGGRAHAVSPKGAVGLMQLMPRTAAEMGVSDSTDAWQNLCGGTKYLSRQLERFGSLDKALAAYNAGPSAVARHGGIPPYNETQTYVRRVIDAKARFDSQFPRDI